MTAESNYVIAIATLSDSLQRVAPVFSTNETRFGRVTGNC